MRSSYSVAAAPVVLIGVDPDRRAGLSWPALAALAAADAVLHEAGVDPTILGLAPRHCLIEPAAAELARARKLAEEGWRVVCLVAGDPAAAAARLAAAGIAAHAIALAGEPQCRPVPTPQHYAPALTGLAG
jgi:siroheme synthase